MPKGFEIVLRMPTSDYVLIVGRDKHQYALGVEIGQKKKRVKWKCYITDSKLPEGITALDVVKELIVQDDPFKEDAESIRKAFEIQAELRRQSN